MYDIQDIKDLTGFERFLSLKGFNLARASNYYLNTYNSVARQWELNGKRITIGLVGSPTRIGVYINYPIVAVPNPDKDVDLISHKEIVKDYSYLPSEKEYDHYLDVLTGGYSFEEEKNKGYIIFR